MCRLGIEVVREVAVNSYKDRDKPRDSSRDRPRDRSVLITMRNALSLTRELLLTLALIAIVVGIIFLLVADGPKQALTLLEELLTLLAEVPP